MRLDDLIPAGGEGHGIDVALQRADDLDLAALTFIQSRVDDGKAPRALDLAGGSGGQGVRMAKAGAEVIVSDILARGDDVAQLAKANHVSGKVRFVQADMADLSCAFAQENSLFDVIVCQRAIHYLPYKKAQKALEGIKRILAEEGRLYLSASGIYSELGEGYPAKKTSIEERFAPLAEDMANHHNILQPVSLYAQDDLRKALEDAGFKVEKLFSSSFGNIKAIATPGRQNG